jgi:hypothetical protein
VPVLWVRLAFGPVAAALPVLYGVSMDKNFDDLEYGFEESSSVAVAEPPNANVVDWEQEGRKLASADHDVKWKLGQWVLDGTPLHDDFEHDPMSTLDHAQSITGLARNTLKDLASTAKRFPASVRTDALSWSHHRVLINTRPESTDDQLRNWLEQAVENNWSVGALAREAKSPVGPRPTLKKSFNVTVPLDVWETLKDLASEERSTVQEIAAQFLMGYCDQEDVKIRRDVAKKTVKNRRREAGRRMVRRNPHVKNNLKYDR